MPPSGFTARQQVEHAKDAAAVPDADVESGKGWCSRSRRQRRNGDGGLVDDADEEDEAEQVDHLA